MTEFEKAAKESRKKKEMKKTIYLTKFHEMVEVHRLLPNIYSDGSMGNLEYDGSFAENAALECDADDIFPEMDDDLVYEYELKAVHKKSELKCVIV